MKILICDDEMRDILHLKKMCESYFDSINTRWKIEIITTTDPESIESARPDVLILDVEMPIINGIRVKDELCKSGGRPFIIFVSAHKEIMSRAFGRNVIGFIEKPAKQYALQMALECALSYLEKEKIVWTQDNDEISSYDIVCIKSECIYTEIVLKDGVKISNQRKALKVWKEELLDFEFIQINESCLLNCNYIEEIRNNEALLTGDRGKLLISRRRRSSCKKDYDAFCKRMAKLI